MAGIYIHIPYCKKLCFYCDFFHVTAKGDLSGFAEGIKAEAMLRREYLGNETIGTIYFGGGTPSVFSARELAGILESLARLFHIDEGSEITVELNPDDVDSNYLKDLKQAGFNRISLGVQSWNDDDLKLMNRRHDSSIAATALNACLDEFSNVSMDLIYGIPGMTLEMWERNLDKTFAFDIKHLSAYHLTFEKGTVFGKMLEKGLIAEADEELSTQMFHMLIRKAEEAGFVQYEISNFGKEGFFSRHNTNYWKQVNYLGLGPSAHSFNGFSRQWNKSDIKSYLKAIAAGTTEYETEELDTRTKFNEYIMVSFRTMWGVDLGYIENTFGREEYDYLINMSSKFRRYGLMNFSNNHLVLSDQGKMISDNIISEFMMTD
ncbi:MAG TPA: radical SAM family heme chaperone HemW [Bacteroidales bacterium]|nr:radical SAM family heme chaperone HemW [Bacteroidales bacterium]